MTSASEPHQWLIATHGGAGYQSTDPASEKAVKHALRSACTAAIGMLQAKRRNSIDAVECAVCFLEDDGCLNAGFGSNLTMDGNVECDASIIDGTSNDFGSVGAVQGVKNPITLARAVMQNSTRPQPLGRVPPLTLVGPGARAFARSSGCLQVVDPDTLISKTARSEWQKWKARFESSTAGIPSDLNPSHTPVLSNATLSGEELSLLEDTVGAVACDHNGGMAAGVSSGGLLLKYPGRIGEAAVYGAGCWAHSPPDAKTGVACSVSGTGEAIIRAGFARSLVEVLCSSPSEDTHIILQSKLEAFCTENEEAKIGVIVVTKEPVEDDTQLEFDFDSGSELDAERIAESQKAEPASNGNETSPRVQSIKLRLWCAFTTDSMALAYASSEDDIDKPRALILRQRTHRNTEGKKRVYISALPLSR